VANYTLSGLPLEVVWSDIEYMPKFWTMEFDPGAQRSCIGVCELHRDNGGHNHSGIAVQELTQPVASWFMHVCNVCKSAAGGQLQSAVMWASPACLALRS
jgi:hypothetical protein